jgi:hypothetical protein
MGSLSVVLILSILATFGGQKAGAMPTLRYDGPDGFAGGNNHEAATWISGSLDGIVHVYAFRPYRGDFQRDFRQVLFRDRVSAVYREDRILVPPVFRPLAVKGAEAAIVATFSNFNGGAPREHLRVAILAAGSVALVDVSASSPEAFQRNWPSISRLLDSLYVE